MPEMEPRFRVKESVIGIRKVQYPGWVIDAKCFKSNSNRIARLKELERPKTVGEMRK